MPRRALRLSTADGELREELADIRRELEIPSAFPEAALAEARIAASFRARPSVDLTEIPFVTIDPPASRDLDQAVHLSRNGRGFLVRYAIADVAAFVLPGGALDAETHQRGVTYYGPDDRAPLHPVELSEGAASLLPGPDRPALVWEFRLDSSGAVTGDPAVRRGVVRSKAKLSYEAVQRDLDDGTADGMLELLPIVGRLRQDLERSRGGVSLPLPEQEIVETPDGLGIEYRSPLPIEGWNAQISLLTGMAAAAMMREAGIGVFRTVPEANAASLARLRRTARALDVPWPADKAYAELIPSLDLTQPAHEAFVNEAAGLFRGSGYLAFDGAVPDSAAHAAIAAEYAHVTAPLRRLVDRYGLEICVATCAGAEVPGWVRDGLPEVQDIMAEAGRRARSYEGMCVAAVEAALLAGREGQRFDGVVVDMSESREHGEPVSGEVVIRAPAVRGRVTGTDLPLGEKVTVSLVEASIPDRRIEFRLE
ncbi:MAG TPA: RNB domain-containing ribonuclease [Jiangellales bacterium]|nr:RNB domain-containing ribonuclease [Jiangellales bacterium]